MNGILCIDVGNTNVVCALYENDIWSEQKRFNTNDHDLAQKLTEYICTIKFSYLSFCSVVPSVTSDLKKNVFNLLKSNFFEINLKCKNNLNTSSIPSELGYDLFCNFVSAHYTYPDDYVMIADFGTAFKTQTVSPSGEILGVTIAPGIYTSLEALNLSASLISQNFLKIPDSVFGLNTVDSISSGIIYGFVGQLHELVNRAEKEISKKIKLLVTGGLAYYVMPFLNHAFIHDSYLTLNGIRILTTYLE